MEETRLLGMQIPQAAAWDRILKEDSSGHESSVFPG